MRKTFLFVLIALVLLPLGFDCSHSSDADQQKISVIKERFKSVKSGDIIELKNGDFIIVLIRISNGFRINYTAINENSRVYDDILAPQVVRIYSYDNPLWCSAVKKFLAPKLSDRE